MGTALVAPTRVGSSSDTDPMAFGCGDHSFLWGDHICAFFDDPDQQMAVMLPFIVQGLRADQRCVWIAPPAGVDRFRRALGRIGGDLLTLEASGQLIVISPVAFYLRDGLFDPARMLALVQALLEDGRRQGWNAMRFAREGLVLRDRPVDVAWWESYEEQITRRLAGAPLVAIGQYVRRGLPSSLIAAAFRTHPIVICGETICESAQFADDVPDAAGRPQVS